MVVFPGRPLYNPDAVARRRGAACAPAGTCACALRPALTLRVGSLGFCLCSLRCSSVIPVGNGSFLPASIHGSMPTFSTPTFSLPTSSQPTAIHPCTFFFRAPCTCTARFLFTLLSRSFGCVWLCPCLSGFPVGSYFPPKVGSVGCCWHRHPDCISDLCLTLPGPAPGCRPRPPCPAPARLPH